MRPTILIRLYPSRWRRRYEDEFAALLEGERWSARLVLDLLAGAIKAHRSAYPASIPRVRKDPLMRTQLDKVATIAIIAVAAAIAIARFIALDSSSDSVSDTIRPWLIQVGIIVAVAAVFIVGVRRLTRWRRRS
jgi:hypothetical protein